MLTHVNELTIVEMTKTIACGNHTLSLLYFVTLVLLGVSVVIDEDAELDGSSVDSVSRTEDRIISHWRDVSADEKSQLRDKVDEILRPLGYETRLLVIDRAKSIALYFACLTLPAVMSLLDQWSSGQLRDIVETLFTFLAGTTRPVRVKRLIWTQTNYERTLKFFSSKQRKQAV